MADKEEIVNLGVDTKDFVAGLKGVKDILASAGGEIIKIVDKFEKFDKAGQLVDLKVKALTSNHQQLEIAFKRVGESLEIVNYKLRSSEYIMRKVQKAIQDLKTEIGTGLILRVDTTPAVNSVDQAVNKIQARIAYLNQPGLIKFQYPDARPIYALEGYVQRLITQMRQLAIEMERVRRIGTTAFTFPEAVNPVQKLIGSNIPPNQKRIGTSAGQYVGPAPQLNIGYNAPKGYLPAPTQPSFQPYQIFPSVGGPPIPGLPQAVTQSHTLLLTWQNLVRLFQIQLAHIFINQLIGALNDATDKSVKLQIKIAEIQTISQENSRSTADWSASLRDLSDSFAIDILDVAEGAYEAISNQIVNASTATNFMGKASEFAKVSVSSLGDSVNLISSILNAYSLSITDTDRVTSVLFRTIEVGRVRASEMANTIGATAALAAQAGVRLEEFSAAIAVATIQGVMFDTSNILMRNVLLKLIKPTDEMKQLFREWGVASGEAAISTFGFTGVLKRFAEEIEKGGISKISKQLEDMRPIQGIVTFTGNSSFDEKYSKTLSDVGGSAEGAKKALEQYIEAKKIALNNPGFKFEQEVNRIRNVLTVDIGDRLVRSIARLSDSFQGTHKVIALFGDLITGATNGMVIFTGAIDLAARSLGVFGINANSAGVLISALGGAISGLITAVTGLSILRLLTTLVATFGGAAGAAALGINAFTLSAAALVLPLSAAVVGVGALAGAFAYLADQRSKAGSEAKREYEKGIREQSEYNTKQLQIEINTLRELFSERNKHVNEQFIPSNKAFSIQVDEALKSIDTLAERVKDLPAIHDALIKPESFNSSQEIEDGLKRMLSKAKGQIEKSLDRELQLQVHFDKQTFEDSIKGLSDSETLNALQSKLVELYNKTNNVFALNEQGQLSLTGSVEDARANLDEASRIIDDIASKKFDIFKETKDSIKESERIIKNLTETFDEREFNRRIGGKTDSQQISALKERSAQAKQKGLQLQDKGDLEGARHQFELADSFLDKAIQKQDVLNKKKGGTGKKSVNGLVDELKQINDLRLGLEEENIDKQKQRQKDVQNSLNQTLKNDRIAVLNRAKEIESQLRLLEEQSYATAVKKVSVAKEYFEIQEKIIAAQKQLEQSASTNEKRKADAAAQESGARGSLIETATSLKQKNVRLTFTTSGEQEKLNTDYDNAIDQLVAAAKDPTNTLDTEGAADNVRELYRKIIEMNPAAANYSIDGKSAQSDIDNITKSIEDYRKAQQAFAGASTELQNIKNGVLDNSNEKITDLIKKLDELRATLGNMPPITVLGADGKPIPVTTIPARANGGMIGGPAPYGSGDNQLIFARSDEFMMNPAATRKFYSTLVAMNNGYAPRGFSQGGPITNNIGDINVSVSGDGTPAQTAVEIGRQLRRGIRNGTIRLT